MDSVLVTGATGFLGKRVCEMALMEGYRVFATGRNQAKGEELKKLGAEFICLDLTDKGMLNELFPDVGVVCHCAALSSPWGTFDQHYSANVVVTRYLARVAKNRGVKRFIYISSPSIYFRFKDQIELKEDDPLPRKLINHYAKSKKLAELALKEEAGDRLEWIVLRPRAIFGPRDVALVPRLIRSNNNGGLPFFNKAAIRCDLTYVDNVAHAIFLSIQATEESCNQAYNITNSEPTDLQQFLNRFFQTMKINLRQRSLPYWFGRSLAEVLEFTCSVTPGKPEPILTSYAVGLFTFSQTLSVKKAEQLLGYKPIVALEDGLKFTANWFAANEKGKSHDD